jgi:transposase
VRAESSDERRSSDANVNTGREVDERVSGRSGYTGVFQDILIECSVQQIAGHKIGAALYSAMPRSTPHIAVSEDQKKQIEQWLAALGTPQQVALRCRIVLAASRGESEVSSAAKLDVNRKTVRLWRKRFSRDGLQSLWEVAPGRGRKATYGPERIKAILDATLQSKPKGITHWSCRLMAASQGISKSTVSNLWRSHNLKPHRTKTFKLSRDPKFLEKLTDVIGLYLNPPDKAIVLCVDEKSQIQALNRTQPGLPLKKGRCGTMTHDYKRNGTTTLFAALDLLQGKVIGDFHKRHRHQEFLKFMRRIDREFPGDKNLHLVMDNYGTHGHADVKAWLSKHPRFVIHYVPTSCSWLNLIERWFGELTNKRIRRDSFFSVNDLVAAIKEFLAVWNENPKPFVWTATVDSIVAKLARCRQTPEQIQPGCTAPKGRKRLSS